MFKSASSWDLSIEIIGQESPEESEEEDAA
jgi:hypothetical protein